MYLSNSTSSNELDLRSILRALWNNKYIVIFLPLLFAAATAIWSLTLPNVYRAKAVVVAAQKGTSQMGGMASSLGGLASLAGINLESGDNKLSLTLEMLNSRRFIWNFCEKYNLMPEVFASTGWEKSTNELVYDSSVYDVKGDKWTRIVVQPKKPSPSITEIYKSFSSLVNVNKSNEGFITISFDSYSPYRAKEILDKLVEELNLVIKKQDQERARDSLTYLSEQLKKSDIKNLDNALYELVEEQMKIIMLSEVDKEYVLQTVDPAIQPEVKESPKRALLVIIGGLIGVFVSLIVVFFKCLLINELNKKKMMKGD